MEYVSTLPILNQDHFVYLYIPRIWDPFQYYPPHYA